MQTESELINLDNDALSAREALVDIRERRRRNYENDPNEILEGFRNELRITEAYNGRQLLELLQNADDAAQSQMVGPRRILLRLTENELLVANTGAPFTAKGIRSLLYANLSAKRGQPELIGAKGLGFRALLSWSQCIRIDSGELHVEFSPKIAHAFLDDLRERSELVRQTLAEEPEPYPIATLRWPALCEAPAQPKVRGFATIIALDLTEAPEVVPGIQAQMCALGPEILVFLQHLDEVVIESSGRTEILYCSGRGSGSVSVRGAGPARDWQVFEHTTLFKGEEYCLKAAWNSDWASEGHTSWLHTFFPTKVVLPFPVLIHGPFELSSNRENLVDDLAGLNRHLIPEIAPLLIKAAMALRAGAGPDVFRPLRTVWNKGTSLQHGLEAVDFGAAYSRHLRSAELFPRLDGGYSTLGEAVYDELPFARFLQAADCPELIVHPTSEEDSAALRGIVRLLGTPNPLRIDTLLDHIASARLALSHADYAQLLALLLRKSKAEQVALGSFDLPNLFIGTDGELLAPSQSQPVFLPSDEDAVPDSKRIPVRIMCIEQAQALRVALSLQSFAELANELSSVHLRAYSFLELARALIDHCTLHTPQRLHSEFFRFFQAERKRLANQLPPQRPAGWSVPVQAMGRAGKAGVLRSAHEVYFGKAYDKPLCEELYHYNLGGKLVAPPAALGLAAKPLVQVVDYLRWCGVAEEPRILVRMLEPAEKPYHDYALRRFDYRRERIEDLNPRSYAELTGYWSGRCQVTTLDDLSGILTKSKRLSTILAWVRGSTELGAHLSRPHEPATSWLEMGYGSVHNWRYVRGRQLTNFIAWQFTTTAWLTVDGWENRMPPERTVLSPTIGPEFVPHLFRLPYKDTRLPIGDNPYGSYAAYKQVLLQVGLRETIESVDVGLLYKVLTLLPTVDPEGRAARSIYRELAENFAWKPEHGEHESYRQFCQKGLVWCLSGKVMSYQPVGSVYYPSSVDHGPALLALFPMLALATGYDKAKVKDIFGVKPLPPLAMRLTNPMPRLHALQGGFEDDWQHLLPYLYAFRKDKSTKEDNLRRLQELRIHLCSTLPVTYQHGHENHPVEIDNYRFVFPGAGNHRTAWLRVPASITSLEQLQQEADACEAVALIVCAVLDTAVDKAHYEMLFAASRTKRDGIVRNKLPGQGEAGLEEARQQLAHTSRASQTFWTQFAYATGHRKKTRLPSAMEAWRPWLLSRHPQAALPIQTLLDEADWDAMGTMERLSSDELELFWQLFEAVNLEPAKFNGLGPLTMDFTPLIISKLEQERDDCRPLFDAALRKQLSSKTVAHQKQYLTRFNAYLNFMPAMTASLKVSVRGAWVKAVSEEFKLGANWDSYPLAFANPYDDNWAQLQAYAKAMDIPMPYVDGFLRADSLIRSLLYFEQIARIKAALYEQYQPPASLPHGTTTASTDQIVHIGTLPYRYANLASLRAQLESLPRPKGPIAVVKPLKPATANGKEASRTRAYAGHLGSDGAAQADKNGQTGFLGELFAYWRLCDLYGEANVVWESGNAKEAGITTETNDSAGYDLRYRPVPGKEWRRVEVKSGWGERPLVEFYLSAGELTEGRRWGKSYELLLVSGVSQGPAGATFSRIEAPFLFKGNQSFLDHPYFQVTTRKYHLRFRM